MLLSHSVITQARRQRDYVQADEIRCKLRAEGVEAEDVIFEIEQLGTYSKFSGLGMLFARLLFARLLIAS